MAAELGNVLAACRAIGIPLHLLPLERQLDQHGPSSCAPGAPGVARADSERQPPEALRRHLAARGWSGASSDPVVGPETSHP